MNTFQQTDQRHTVFAIDPGTTQSAYTLWDGQCIRDTDIVPNPVLLDMMQTIHTHYVTCEQVESYGMRVGKEVFETVFWSGRFCQRASARGLDMVMVPRRIVKMHLCGRAAAKDADITRVLKDRFGEKPTKARPSPVYGHFKLKKDEWQSFALAVTFYDQQIAAPDVTIRAVTTPDRFAFLERIATPICQRHPELKEEWERLKKTKGAPAAINLLKTRQRELEEQLWHK